MKQNLKDLDPYRCIISQEYRKIHVYYVEIPKGDVNKVFTFLLKTHISAVQATTMQQKILEKLCLERI